LQAGDTYTDTKISEESPMANREVNLTKRVQTPLGMRYCPVVFSANGRLKPDQVLVNGKPEQHKEGAYYLDGGRTVSAYGCPLETTMAKPPIGTSEKLQS
jgi:hypothetical protein